MIDPSFLDELDRFYASIARDSYARRRGDRESPAVGEGLTFADFRQYTPGDEPRLVDWKLFARTEQLYVKQFEEERQATVHVLLDASESMDFGTDTEHKFEYGAKVGLGSAYLAAREHEQFRFTVFGEELDRWDRSRSNRGEILRLIDRVNDFQPEGAAEIGETLEAYARTIDTTALVLVISDFLEDTGDLEHGLAALANHDVVLAHVLSPDERDPPTAGDTIFAEPESGRTLRTYFGGQVDTEYTQRLEAHLRDVANVAFESRARHKSIDTGRPFFDSFSELWAA